jgi:hypothetical protein
VRGHAGASRALSPRRRCTASSGCGVVRMRGCAPRDARGAPVPALATPCLARSWSGIAPARAACGSGEDGLLEGEPSEERTFRSGSAPSQRRRGYQT